LIALTLPVKPTLANDAKRKGFGALRSTGFDCNALDLASSAAASAGIKVLAGIYVSVGMKLRTLPQLVLTTPHIRGLSPLR